MPRIITLSKFLENKLLTLDEQQFQATKAYKDIDPAIELQKKLQLMKIAIDIGCIIKAYEQDMFEHLTDNQFDYIQILRKRASEKRI